MSRDIYRAVLAMILVLMTIGQRTSEASSQAKSHVCLRGTVCTKDGSPVKGIRVRCYYLARDTRWEYGQQITDEEGRYVFEVPVGRPYGVGAGGEKSTHARSQTYEARQEKDILIEDLVVRPCTATVKGRVVFDDGRPARNLDYGYVSGSFSPIDAEKPPKTNGDGEFVAHLLPDEPYSFWVFVEKNRYRVWKRLDPNVSGLELTLRSEDCTELPDDWLYGGFTHEAIARDMVYAKDSMIDFALPDLAGKVVSLSDLRAGNKAVVVNITGTWCGGCREEAPYLVDFYRRYKDKGLAVVSIAFEPTSNKKPLDAIRAFEREFNINYTLLHGGPASRKHVESVIRGLRYFRGYPTTLYIDRNGKVQFIQSGFWIHSEPHKKWQLDLMGGHIRSILSSGEEH